MSSEEILSTLNFDNLLKLGYAVIDARFCDYEINKNTYKFVIVRIDGDRNTYYLDMLKSYNPAMKLEKNVYELWSKILSHKISMSKILNRDISIKVALFDYLEMSNS